MPSWLSEHFLWLKAMHILSVISWMAALLYLPRLYVYHARTSPGSETSETFKVMERRLSRGIMTPAMIGTVVFGLLMLAAPGVLQAGGTSLLIKLGLVVLLLAQHFAMLSWGKAFAEDRNQKSDTFFRIANEVPTLLMILIVILIVIRPL